MAVSRFFKHTTASNEQGLLDDLTREVIYQRGEDMSYIPKTAYSPDAIFGEDPSKLFSVAVELEMMIEDVESFGGEGDYIARYGLDIRDEVTFIFSKTRFVEEVTKDYPAITRPREGDLIAYENTNSVFEITFVEHEKPFYQLGKNVTYACQAKKFEYSHEDITSGITEVDNLPTTAEHDDASKIDTEAATVVNFDESSPFGDF